MNINLILAQAKEVVPDAETTVEGVSFLKAMWNELKDFVRMTKDQVKSLGSKILAVVIVVVSGTLVSTGIAWLSILLGFLLL
ncbi:MAG: hypothetical protein ABJ327_17960 [Litoreibacter sp.]